jgi:propionate CoA-transferase
MGAAIVPTARPGKTGKIVAARKAARMIRTGDTVAIGGFFGLAMEVIHALAAIYDESDTEAASFGKPRDLTLVWCVSPGEGQQRGAQRLAQSGLIKRLIGGHWTAVPALYQLVAGNQVIDGPPPAARHQLWTSMSP